MKTNIILLKNAASLVALQLLSLCCCSLSAQVIYTDIIPDYTPNASFGLDLNNDGIVDFTLQMASADQVMCFPHNSNAYAGELVAGGHLAWAMSLSENICHSLATWYDSGNPGTLGLGTNIGHWPGVTDRYLALKLVVESNTYYGWVRMDVYETSSSFTIKDYAYEGLPDGCILAGQITTGINENTANNHAVVLFPNPFSTQAILKTDIPLQNATLTLMNSVGQTVAEIKNIFGPVVTISKNDLPGGLYLIRLTEGNNVITTDRVVIAD